MQQVLIPIDLAEFQKMLQDTVREEIDKVLEGKKYEKIIRTEEACKLLGVSEVTLLSWRKKGLIPFFSVGNRVLYDKDELMDSIRKLPNGKGRRKKR